MQRDISDIWYQLRFVWFGAAVVVLLVVFSSLVTMLGTDTLIDPNGKLRQAQSPSMVQYNSSNAVTDLAFTIGDGIKRASVVSGTALFTACSSVTANLSNVGSTLANLGSSIASGIGSGITAVTHGVGHGASVAISTPGRAVQSVARGQIVSAIIQPSQRMAVPVIDGETSPEQLNRLEEQQRAQIAKLLEDQRVANAALAGAVVNGAATHGGYPARWDTARQDSLIDDWGMYNRECVSYAAWKVYQAYGRMPYWGGVGNANQWVRNAQRAGIPTGRVPQVGSVAISHAGYYGHAMWVERVEGSRIYVSQYNYDLRGHYSEMWIDGSSLTYIYFR